MKRTCAEILMMTIVGLATASAAAQTQSNWTNGEPGDSGWSTPGNWNPQMTPNNDDMDSYEVIMNAAVANLSENITISGAVFGQGAAGGAVINGSGQTFTVEGPIAIDIFTLGGAFPSMGSGTFTSQGFTSIARTFNIDGTWVANLGNILLGTGAGNGDINIRGSGKLNVNGTVDLLNDSDVESTGVAGAQFNLDGMLIKSGGIGLSEINVPFVMDNLGQVQANTGLLQFSDSVDIIGSLATTGNALMLLTDDVDAVASIQVADTSAVEFSSASIMNSLLDGMGTGDSHIRANNGTTITSTTLNFPTASHPFEFDGLTMDQVTNRGVLKWGRGKIIGMGVTNEAGATIETTIGAAGVPEIENATLANQGTLNIDLTLDILDQGKIVHTGGEMQFDGGGSINARNGGESTGLITQIAPIVMNGTSPTSRSIISAPITSTGMIDVIKGELRFDNANDDKIQISGADISVDRANGSGALFSLGANNSSKSSTFNASFVLTNGGIAQWFRGLHKVRGTIDAIGEGILRNDGATMVVESGQAASLSTSNTTPFEMNSTNATMQADGAFENLGFMSWISGAITGPAPTSTTGDDQGIFSNASSGLILVPGTLRISRGPGTGNDRGGTLKNDGEIRLTNGLFGGIAIDFNGLLNNSGNGIVTIMSDQDITEPIGGSGAGKIDNQGTITKAAGNSDTLVTVQYKQSGAAKLRAESGLLRMFGESIEYFGGTLEADGTNTRLETDKSSTTENVTFKLTNGGVVDFGFATGTVFHDIAGTLGSASGNGNGTLRLSGGTMRPRDANASLEITENAAFEQTAGTLGAVGKSLENKGNHEMRGGTIVGDFFNRAAGQFLLDNGTISANLFINDGRFEWTGGTIDAQFTNNTDASVLLSADNDVLLASNAKITNNALFDHNGVDDLDLGENAQFLNNANGEYLFSNGGRVARVASIIEGAEFINAGGRIANEGGVSSSIDVKFTSTGGTIETRGNGNLSINGVVGEQGGEPLINGGTLGSAIGATTAVTGELRTLGAKLQGTITHDHGNGGTIVHTLPEVNFQMVAVGDGKTRFNGGETPDGGGLFRMILNADSVVELAGNMKIGGAARSTEGYVLFDGTNYDLFRQPTGGPMNGVDPDVGTFTAGSDIEFLSNINDPMFLSGPPSGDRQTFTIEQLRLALVTGSSTVRMDGRVELINNGTLEFVSLGGGFSQSNFGNEDQLIRNNGTVRKFENTSTGSTTVDVPFINSGTVHCSAGGLRFSNCLTLNGTELEEGTWIVESGTILNLKSGGANPILTNNATITLRGNWSWLNLLDDINHDFLNDDDGVFNLEQGARFTCRGEFENDGIVNIDPTSHLIIDTLDNDSVINVNGRLSFGIEAMFSNGTTMGTGIINGTQITNNANISPGNSPGELTINADFANSPTGTITIELAGTTSGTDYDVLTVNGPVTLAGTLDVQLLDGFQPSSADTFTIITGTSVVGSFDNAPNAGGTGTLTTADGEFTVAYNSNSIALSGFIPANGGLIGDMNCDGAVTVGDIGGFVLALTDPAGYAAQFPTCDITNADVNDDGSVTVGDIGPFVQLLTGG